MVRSAELFSYRRTGGTSFDGPTTRYTVSSGHTVIVKRLIVATFGSGTPAIIVYQGQIGFVQPVYLNLAVPAATVVDLDTWFVLEPGAVLQTFDDPVNSADILWISAHGAILEGVA